MASCGNNGMLGLAVLATSLFVVTEFRCAADDSNETSTDVQVHDIGAIDDDGDSGDLDTMTPDVVQAPTGPCPVVQSSVLATSVGQPASWDVSRAPQGIVVAVPTPTGITIGYLADGESAFEDTHIESATLGIGAVVAVAVAAMSESVVLAMVTNDNPHLKVIKLGYDGSLANGGIVQTVAGLGEPATSIRFAAAGVDSLGLVAVSGSTVPTAYGFVLGSADGKKLFGPIVLGSSVVSGIAEAVASENSISAVFHTAEPLPKIVRSTFDVSGKLMDMESVLADGGGFGAIESPFGAYESSSGIGITLFAKTDGTPVPRGGYLVRQTIPAVPFAPDALWTAAAAASDGDDVFAVWRADGVIWGQWIDDAGEVLDEPITLGGEQSKAGHLRALAQGDSRYLTIWGSSSGLHVEIVDCSIP